MTKTAPNFILAHDTPFILTPEAQKRAVTFSSRLSYFVIR
ncbi:hypothetical protein FM123_06940 [Limosilactobacillus fermentum]|nr:hypothetical protein FM122_08390 [Limosilactobacillus fermentum]SJM58705.1 hypothetical protein FM123_06940 [Limosilactobacillus fermentum]